jgi:salicylate hydroxylase
MIGATRRPYEEHSMEVSVCVVGGGIGGLTVALSLFRRGFDVQVYEQAAALGEVGAGVQVSPNASRVLHRLGLAEELAATGVKPVAWHQRRWDDGRTLLRSPLAEPLEATFGFPHYQLHRADLLAALAGALPAERVHLGHRLTGLTDRGDRVEARFANGASVEADVLVGADGIKSAVRGLLFGPEHPRFTGCVAYRGLVPAERLTDLQLEVTAQVWMGPGRHFVHYFVSGGGLVNFVAIIEQDTWTRESWTDRGDIADVLKAFEGWHPQVRTILASADETFIWALFDHVPLRRWSAGRVTLLGDACHAMLPFMAQGAAQAIEDGATLATCLAAATRDIPGALRHYEALRLPREAHPRALHRKQDPLPLPGRARSTPARRRNGRGKHRLVVQSAGMDLRTRRVHRDAMTQPLDVGSRRSLPPHVTNSVES